MRHVLSVILTDHGYEVRAVADGEEALRELAARDYDVVLTDVRMPGMDGLALLREVAAAAPRPHRHRDERLRLAGARPSRR